MKTAIAKEEINKLLDPVWFLEHYTKLHGKPTRLDNYQKEFLRDKSRFRAIVKSKKVGMSTIIAGEAFHKAYVNKNIDCVIVATGERIAEEILAKIYSFMYSMPRNMQPKRVQGTERSKTAIGFMNGSRIFCVPSSPDTIRGLGLRGVTYVYWDEAAWRPEKEKELWIALRDFAIIGGSITMLSTPAGMSGIFHDIVHPLQELFNAKVGWKANETSITTIGPLQVESGEGWEWGYHQIPYWVCNRLKEQEKLLKTETDETSFLREYTTQFTDERLSIFPMSLLLRNTYEDDGELPPFDIAKSPITFMGADFAKKINETAIFVVEKMAGQRFIVRHQKTYAPTKKYEEDNYSYYDEVLNYMNSLARQYNPTVIKIDEGQVGVRLIEELKKLPYNVNGVKFTLESKEKMIMDLLVLFEQNRIKIPKDMKLIGQLNAIRRETTAHGNVRYSGKESGLDDMVFALALAVFGETNYNEEVYIDVMQDKATEKYSKNIEKEMNQFEKNDEFLSVITSEEENPHGVVL